MSSKLLQAPGKAYGGAEGEDEHNAHSDN